MPHYCDDTNCKYNNDQTCTAGNAYHVSRYCVSKRRKPKGENYRELMQPSVGICQRNKGSMKRKGGGVLK
ncbi:hypothetical protein SDC9_114435 [bioreactor metagenome]|uniref:Uncharacterized protein n=1 Tax=bioreactor metagenome TaxID=1076179 RepID=A0A645BQN0_9ZZZZ